MTSLFCKTKSKYILSTLSRSVYNYSQSRFFFESGMLSYISSWLTIMALKRKNMSLDGHVEICNVAFATICIACRQPKLKDAPQTKRDCKCSKKENNAPFSKNQPRGFTTSCEGTPGWSTKAGNSFLGRPQGTCSTFGPPLLGPPLGEQILKSKKKNRIFFDVLVFWVDGRWWKGARKQFPPNRSVFAKVWPFFFKPFFLCIFHSMYWDGYLFY